MLQQVSLRSSSRASSVARRGISSMIAKPSSSSASSRSSSAAAICARSILNSNKINNNSQIWMQHHQRSGSNSALLPLLSNNSRRGLASLALGARAMQQQATVPLDSASAKGTPSSVLPSPFDPTLSKGAEAVHFRINDAVAAASAISDASAIEKDYTMPHRIWTKEEVHQVSITHHEPKNALDWTAYISIKCIRAVFDLLSGFAFGRRTESKWLTRIIFLESVAAVPGMVGAMIRHLQSLRLMRRDYGWIHTLLEEAENERMHLLTALQLKQPGPFFRLAVLGVQGVMTNTFFLLYLVAPRFVHRFVGYLEEEAVYTYTKCIGDLEAGELPMWSSLKAPPIAQTYWKLPADATIKDVIYAIRSDEAHHRLVNHTFANMHELGVARNPYGPGE